MPAAMVTAYSSQMPTSKQRSGNFCENSLNPTPSFIAAVTATRFLFCSARSHRSLPSAVEKEFSPAAKFLPVPWKREGSSSAGAYPLPLQVTACKNTGSSILRMLESTARSSRRSCPSTGPMYLNPHRSKKSFLFSQPFKKYLNLRSFLPNAPVSLNVLPRKELTLRGTAFWRSFWRGNGTAPTEFC